MKTNPNWPDPRLVECPRCGVGPGVDCVTANGTKSVGAHTGRTFAAMGRKVEERWKAHPPKAPKPPSRLTQLQAEVERLTAAIDEFRTAMFEAGTKYAEVMIAWGKERELADRGADVLSRMVVGWKAQTGIDLAEHPDVVAFFAEYREARGTDEREG